METLTLNRSIVLTLSTSGFILILATGILESLSPAGVFLSWGYIIGIFLTMMSNRKSYIIAAAILTAMIMIFLFSQIADAEQRNIALLNRTYAFLGIGTMMFFLLRVIRRETDAENNKTQMEGIFSFGTQGIILADAKDGKIVLVNPFTEKIFGYEKGALTGSKIDLLIPEIGSSNPDPSTNLFSGQPGLEFLAKKKNGDAFMVETSISRYESGGVHYVVFFIVDISARKQNEEILTAKKMELEAINKELDAFTYSVSHDLRAPLRAVSGYARMLEDDYVNILDQEGKRLLRVIQQNAKNMGILIDDLLSFSRLGKKEVRKSVVNMTAIATEIHHQINESMVHNAEVHIEKLDDAMADPVLIKHVLINILSNAVKYSSKVENPSIRMSSLRNEHEVIYSVQDNGAGFDMQYVGKLFGVFQRLHSNDEFIGTGVGLAIAQRIIHKHKGRIWAEGAPGKGATFYFSLAATPEM